MTRIDEIPEVIRKLNDAGIDCQQIAKRVGVSRATVYSWLQGVEPRYWAGHGLMSLAQKYLNLSD